MPTDDHTRARLDEHHERISTLEGRVTGVEQVVSDVRADVKILGTNMATNTLMTAEVAKDTKDLVTLQKMANMFYKIVGVVSMFAVTFLTLREIAKLTG